MKMKKLLCIALVLMLAISAVACGGGGDDQDNADGDAAKIKLGGIGPLTGGAAVYGIAVNNGAQIAVDEINALGGDIQFDYNFQDDEHDAEKAVNAYSKLKDWGLQILMGTVTTSPCIAVSSETNADRIFELTPSASSTDVTKGKDNVFQMCFTDPNQGITAADYIADNSLGQKVAVIYNNADAYSTGIYTAFASEAGTKGLELVYTGTFASDDNADFTVQLKGAKDAGAELVFLPIYYTPASLILAQAKSMEYAPTFFGVDGMDGILTLEGFDTTLAEGVMLMTPFNPWSEDEKVASFVASYKEKYNENPNQFAADAYDCVYAIYDACQKAGVTADMSAEDICTALTGQFTGDFTFDGITGHGMTWSTAGEVSKAPVVCVIQDGIYVDM